VWTSETCFWFSVISVGVSTLLCDGSFYSPSSEGSDAWYGSYTSVVSGTSVGFSAYL